MKSHSDKKTYQIDVRVFLAAITTTMALAFGIGVAFGPSYPLPVTDLPGSPGDFSSSSSNRAEILNERHVNLVQPSLEDLGAGSVEYNPTDSGQRHGSGGDETKEYMPAGQHLLVDIKQLEAAFLNSEERLADAMVKSVEAAGLTMLSYHCHALQPAGVSCVGVLLESHISFHTWPEEGVITLDLFTCGDKPLLPVVPDLERLFGHPRVDPETGELQKPKMQWSHELRGFRSDGLHDAHHLDSRTDLSYWIMSALQYHVKEEVLSTMTEHQRVDIWDYLDVDDTPSHEDAKKHNLTEGDPRWLTPEVATPDRYIFLNGYVFNMRDSEHELYESMVQPAMFTHPNPTNVAILGGAHGAVLREVLKHNTVSSAKIIEIDGQLVEIAREHLKYMNDCSEFEGGTKDCYDDERVELIVQNQGEYFSAFVEDEEAEKFDVVIMDMHDFAYNNTPTKDLYSDTAFIDNILNSMSDDGILGIKYGDAASIHAPRADVGMGHDREKFMNALEKHPLTSAIFVYEEAHCGFPAPLSYLVVCKESSCRKRWYAASDATDTDIFLRLFPAVDPEESVLVHYDGSTQENFQHTPIGWETVYCRREPKPFECDYRGLDVKADAFEYHPDDPDESYFEIKTEEVDGVASGKVYALDDMPAGSYIMPMDLASSFSATDDVLDNLKANTEITGTGSVSVIEDFLGYVDENGHATMHEGRELTYVEVGASFIIRKSEDESEVNIAKWMPPHPEGQLPTYSPVYERHMVSYDVFLVASKDIKAGDELVKPMDLW